MTFSWKNNPKSSDFSKEIPVTKEIPYQNAENSVSELLDFLLVPRPNASLVYAKSGYGRETGTITYCFETISKNSRCLRPCLYMEKLSRGSVSTRKKSTLCPSQQCSRILWLPRLDRVEPAGRAKVFIRRKVGLAMRVTRPSRKGFLTAPTLSFSCKRFATFYKQMWEKLAISGKLG